MDRIATIDQLVNLANNAGTDRLSFVRPAIALQHSAGVLVVMIGTRAACELGTFLMEVARKCPPKKLEGLPCDGATPALQCLEAVEASGSQWGWGNAVADGKQILFFILVGPLVTEAFAGELTRRGCATRLS